MCILPAIGPTARRTDRQRDGRTDLLDAVVLELLHVGLVEHVEALLEERGQRLGRHVRGVLRRRVVGDGVLEDEAHLVVKRLVGGGGWLGGWFVVVVRWVLLLVGSANE